MPQWRNPRPVQRLLIGAVLLPLRRTPPPRNQTCLPQWKCSFSFQDTTVTDSPEQVVPVTSTPSKETQASTSGATSGGRWSHGHYSSGTLYSLITD